MNYNAVIIGFGKGGKTLAGKLASLSNVTIYDGEAHFTGERQVEVQTKGGAVTLTENRYLSIQALFPEYRTLKA